MIFSNLSVMSLMFQGFPGVSPESTCTDSTFMSIRLENAEILSVSANVSDVTLPDWPTNEWPTKLTDSVTACKVTVQYTHPGWDDIINTYVWLPVSGWNGRFMGVGGGGWSTGNIEDLGPPLSKGYAAATTDGGHLLANMQELSWAHTSPGNLNWPALQNFAAVSLDDAATLGKDVATAFYGKRPKYSYWNAGDPARLRY